MMLMNELLFNEIKRDNLSCEDARKMYEMIEKKNLLNPTLFQPNQAAMAITISM